MMNQPTAVANPEAYLRVMRVLWAAFLICVGLFALVTWVTRPAELPAEISRGVHPMLYALGAAALAAVAASFVFRGSVYRRAALQRQPALMQVGLILALAFCEAAVLFGLVGVFATRNDAAYLLFALGGLGMLLHFPRREQVMSAFYKPSV